MTDVDESDDVLHEQLKNKEVILLAVSKFRINIRNNCPFWNGAIMVRLMVKNKFLLKAYERVGSFRIHKIHQRVMLVAESGASQEVPVVGVRDACGESLPS